MSPDRKNSSNNSSWVAVVTSIFIAAFWIAKRGVDYLQRRYPNVPLLEAIGQAWSDANNPTPPAVTTTAPQPIVPASDILPENRITPYPTTEAEVRADFNPNINSSAEPAVVTEPQPQPTNPIEPQSGVVYALLVGIDTYPAGIRSLRGCVNDVNYFEQYLHDRVAQGANAPLVSVLKLTNGDATRQAVIDGWRTHLGQASDNDVALFYYAGHGAQSRAPFEFDLLEPDNKLESLVCYDSRTSAWDLADQEIGQLIHEISSNNPHIVTIFDCCNSGTVTREIEGEALVRQVALDPRNRTIDSFIVQPSAVNGEGQIEALPEGRHIVLSACQAFELAQEKRINGQQRGVFSYYLLDSLQRTTVPPTYRDLFKRVNALVRANVSRQSPMIEATDSAELNQPFLGGKVDSDKPYFTLSHRAPDVWQIDGGAVHGLRPPQGGMTTWLTLFANTTDNDELLDAAGVIGYAKVQELFPASARVQVRLLNGAAPDEGETYKAVVSATAVRPVGVKMTGDTAALDMVRNVLDSAGVGSAPSVFVAESADDFQLLLTATDDVYRIQSADDAYNLAVETVGHSASSAHDVVDRLEHIARWHTLLDLENPTSRLPLDSTTLVVENRDEPARSSANEPNLNLRYQQDSAGRWQPPRIRIRVTNHSDRRLYCSVVALSQAYGVIHVRSDWVEPGDSIDRTGRSRVDEGYHRAGVTTTTDVYKLFVSTDELDMQLAAQRELPIVFLRQTANSAETPPRSSLEQLLNQAGTRTFEPDDDDDVPLRDWYTSAVTVTTTRPQRGREVGGEAVRLSNAITVAAHPALQASARLSTLDEATRDLSTAERGVVPPLFRRIGPTVQTVDLMNVGARSGQPELNVLELFDVQNHEAVSAESPLEIYLSEPLPPGDVLMSIAHDDEFYLPLGFGRATDNGCTVRIERLPEPTAAGVRTVRGSIRILFQKLVGQRFGFEYTYPQLALVTRDAATGEMRYEPNDTLVQQAVSGASRALLVIHGIFDDTQLMAQRVPALFTDQYDVTLAFDYENLDTTIKENGKLLFQQLSAAGFGAADAPQLDIVAHSMGGLVARSMIEQWGGGSFVSRLLTLGTPHNGTPWARIQDFALVGLSALINGMTTVTWPLRVAAALVQAIEKFDTTLDNMGVGSDFLDELNATNDPQVQYVVVAGDTALLAEATVDSAEKPSRIKRLLKRLHVKRLSRDVATLAAFFGAPNDLAVSVNSARAVPPGRDPQPIILPPAAVDHLSFFRSDVGLQMIADSLDKKD